jgi:alpha-glucosidase
MGLGLGLSGVANTGHDVGGFGGHAPSPELFLRWVQSGIFHPRFTIHSWKPTGATEPWMYPQLFPLVQEAIYFRYRLIPYLYNLAVEAAETGHPIIRPLVYEFPADPRVASESFDFMLGPALLVASVLTPRARSRRVYLPAGQDWYDFYTHERLSGGKTHTIAAPLERTPLLAREGSFVPMGEVVHPQYHARDDLRQVHVFPHFAAGETTFELTEDDGHSLAYRRGEITRIRFQLTSTPRELALGIDLPVYRFPLPYSELELIFPAGETRPVTLPGASRRWLDERSRVHLAWPVPQFGGY